MAGGTLEIIINPEDWRALQRLLTPPEHLYAEPGRNGMSELATKGGLAAQRGAPADAAYPHRWQGRKGAPLVRCLEVDDRLAVTKDWPKG